MQNAVDCKEKFIRAAATARSVLVPNGHQKPVPYIPHQRPVMPYWGTKCGTVLKGNSMIDKMLKMFGGKKKSEKSAEPKEKVEKPKKSEKEIATEKGEPYVAILSMDVNPENLSEGSFELDWNEKFVANLVRAGYMMNKNDTDSDIVDRWFQNVCRHVVMETWEQEEAMNPQRHIKSRDLGNGRREVS
jgi:hypothetical protein